MRLFTILLSFIILACSTKSSDPADQRNGLATEVLAPTLELVWASDTLFRTPESVLFDVERGVIYVANVNLNPWEKDGNGFISKMDLNGNITELEWVSGLHGPKGMGISGNSLYVADIDEVVEIDIESAKIVNRYQVEGTPTLNDVTVGNGVILISGSDSNKLFELKNGEVIMIMEAEFGRPNGLYIEPDRLLMITSNSSVLKSINLETQETTDLVDSLGHGDGIVPVGDGDYLASSWRGQLFYITADLERIELLDTRTEEINAADIEYIRDENLLLVPTFFDNRVVAYRLKIPSR